MGTFRVTIEIGDPQGGRFVPVEALVDTGATYTVLPGSLLRRLEAFRLAPDPVTQTLMRVPGLLKQARLTKDVRVSPSSAIIHHLVQVGVAETAPANMATSSLRQRRCSAAIASLAYNIRVVVAGPRQGPSGKPPISPPRDYRGHREQELPL